MPTTRERLAKRNIPYGFYNSWCDMKKRCSNANRGDFPNYGGRGIKYCKEWEHFDNFYADMIDAYKKGLTLDRINNNGNYCLSNCSWATRKIQNNNSRRNRLITWRGVTKTLAQWSEYLGIKSSTIRQRLDAYGWSLNRSFTERPN